MCVNLFFLILCFVLFALEQEWAGQRFYGKITTFLIARIEIRDLVLLSLNVTLCQIIPFVMVLLCAHQEGAHILTITRNRHKCNFQYIPGVYILET